MVKLTDGQVLVLCVLLPWPASFFLALLIGRFLKAGASKPTPRERAS